MALVAAGYGFVGRAGLFRRVPRLIGEVDLTDSAVQTVELHRYGREGLPGCWWITDRETGLLRGCDVRGDELGAAADLVSEAARSGVDAFVTGETSHVAWHRARELGVNVFFAGHYASETLGVRALGDHLAGEFGVETVFLDSPTGY